MVIGELVGGDDTHGQHQGINDMCLVTVPRVGRRLQPIGADLGEPFLGVERARVTRR